MRTDKEAAISMRQTGMSYSQIRDKLRIPKATLSDWFSSESWSNEIRRRLTKAASTQNTVRIIQLANLRGSHLSRAYASAKIEAAEELETLKYNPLFISGIMLYWGEGDKRTRHITRLINTDAEMIRLYVLFLKNACRIPEEKIRATVTIYPDLDPEQCISYWSRISGIGPERFGKCATIQGRHKTRKLSYGMCTVFVSSTYFKVKMLEWLRLLPEKLSTKDYYAKM